MFLILRRMRKLVWAGYFHGVYHESPQNQRKWTQTFRKDFDHPEKGLL